MTSIKFYNETLTRTKVVNNILRVFDATTKAERSANWYKNAYDFCFNMAFEHNVYCEDNESKKISVIQACAICAALSPVTSWTRNMDLVNEFLNNYRLNDPLKTKCLGLSKSKALEIAELDPKTFMYNDIQAILNGSKITAFFNNIWKHLTSKDVTVDRHALSIALGIKLSNDQFKTHSMTKKQYKFFADCYSLAASKRDVTPLQMQAITWDFWRINGVEFQKELKNILKLK